ncbi:LOW QUALITY PROTEIN: phosphatase and actin regulator 1, partial [Synchiropus picturatus]
PAGSGRRWRRAPDPEEDVADRRPIRRVRSKSDTPYITEARISLHLETAGEVERLAALRSDSLVPGSHTPPIRRRSRLASLGRLFKPWKWRKKKSDAFRQTSAVLERKMSTRLSRQELIRKGVLHEVLETGERSAPAPEERRPCGRTAAAGPMDFQPAGESSPAPAAVKGPESPSRSKQPPALPPKPVSGRWLPPWAQRCGLERCSLLGGSEVSTGFRSQAPSELRGAAVLPPADGAPARLPCGKWSPPLPPKKLLMSVPACSPEASPLIFHKCHAPPHPPSRIIEELNKTLALTVQRWESCGAPTSGSGDDKENLPDQADDEELPGEEEEEEEEEDEDDSLLTSRTVT